MIGEWDGWLAPGIHLDASVAYPGWSVTQLELPPGIHRYLILEDGVGRLDPHNGQTSFWQPTGKQPVEVSLATVPDCSSPDLHVQNSTWSEGSFHIEAKFEVADSAAAAIDASAVTVERFETQKNVYTNVSTAAIAVDSELGTVDIKIPAQDRGKYTFRVTAADRDGVVARPVRVSGWVSPRAQTRDDMLIYQVMLDRFRGSGGQSLAPPDDPGARAGGVLDGVTQAIDSGELLELGVTTLWLSPVYLGPDAARKGRDDDHLYENYHGYWVLDPRGVESRIGGEAALRELIATAHAAGIGVLLDVVPNHVYEDSLRFTERIDDTWFNFHTSGECVCGTLSCPWHLYIQKCWFTSYLPDYRFETPGVIEQAVEDVLWWDRTFDLDGVRIDAVPMMPRATSRRIAHALRNDRFAEPRSFVLGEVFTGEGQGGIDELRYHLGPDGLDSVFDFPLMWAMRGALAHGDSQGFVAVEQVLEATQSALAGSGAVLGRMIGNHDVTRFVSEAAGDAGGDPWLNPPVQPVDDTPYLRQRLALALVLTLPGAPVVYYGDEVGLAGGRDPDNRRVMPADLMPVQMDLRATVQALATLRLCTPALRRGSRRSLHVTPDTYAFVRSDAGREVVVVMSRAETPTEVDLAAAELGAENYLDVLTGETSSVDDGRLALSVPAFGLRVLVPQADICG